MAIRQAGTHAANVARSDAGKSAALERRNIEAAEQIVEALGTMKGVAMKVGQVMSFLDVGLVPEEYREEFQKKLGALRDAAPTVTFKQMGKVIEEEIYGWLQLSAWARGGKAADKVTQLRQQIANRELEIARENFKNDVAGQSAGAVLCSVHDQV